MASAGAPIPKVASVAAVVVVFFLLLILSKEIMPAAAGVTKCSDYCRAKCSLGCEDSGSACTTGNIICKDYPETCHNCRALAIGSCFGACYRRCTDDCI
ncbi:hypothetical protein BDA96_01G440700 [Sorghum bicolor]|jgi:hypothetical protein|uniref:Uncharacterized protein n=2 Tax=Sorghum bicolor TaxID=4558 RepID=A0A921S5I7_SORBI|nr:uncharacterized protein LOC110431923 [Sorghum bicolor]KAG0551645.1 hypothetical protein BDA96_01G440700 [Sorghum bicolor]KXG39649.1 hypothetical protein SORBI_3001G414300 [Sorghum bicolor]|eukprot:XP_021307417.1 uncharacterized protein LOC110431923 [Sorghum bicolor]